MTGHVINGVELLEKCLKKGTGGIVKWLVLLPHGVIGRLAMIYFLVVSARSFVEEQPAKGGQTLTFYDHWIDFVLGVNQKGGRRLGGT
jgi:hypothetical protein